MTTKGDVARVGAEEERKDRHYKSQRSQPRYVYTHASCMISKVH